MLTTITVESTHNRCGVSYNDCCDTRNRCDLAYNRCHATRNRCRVTCNCCGKARNCCCMTGNHCRRRPRHREMRILCISHRFCVRNW